MSSDQLVTVVIPAYNGAATIDETLRSVRSQTHRALEILVVDDGSSDATPAIVERHAAADARVRLIWQSNGGVAAARNRGVAEAKAELVALVDADDLWAPTKIEKQVAALDRGGPKAALAYTWSISIDEESRVFGGDHRPRDEGDVLERTCLGNLVGNGSAALMRKHAFIEAGAYDTSLRARGAQGCEDFKLYFRIAERYHFAVIPEHLTGYRQTAGNMSGDLLQMARSYAYVAAEMRERHPTLAPTIARGEASFISYLLVCAIKEGRGKEALRLASTFAGRAPLLVLNTLLVLPLRFIVRRALAHMAALCRALRRSRTTDAGASRFAIGDPDPSA